MRILVTGGAGYVGSSLVRELIKSHRVAILDNFRFGEASIEQIKDQITIIQGDLRDLDDNFKQFLENTDVVIHLAGLSKEPTSKYPLDYCFDLNYLATKKLARLSRDAGVKKFIFASSCSVYFGFDTPQPPPEYTEKDEIQPVSAYSISKRAAELALLQELSPNFDVVILRKATIFGLSYRMRFDLVVNSLVKDAFFKGKIKVFDGVCRPLVDIKTVVSAYKYAAENSIPSGIYNVSDFNISLTDLADKVANILPKKPKIIVEKPKAERNYLASNRKFKEFFQIEPERSFEEAVNVIWGFLRENPEDKEIYYNKNL